MHPRLRILLEFVRSNTSLKQLADLEKLAFLDCTNSDEFKGPRFSKVLRMAFSIVRRFLVSVYFVVIVLFIYLLRKAYVKWRTFITAK